MISREQLRRIKQMNTRELETYLKALYQQGFEDGLREAEKEFDDPELYQIVDADRVKETLGEAKYNELIKGEKHGTD